ncbi:BcPG4, endopolygalacturonase 4 [Rhexocercosporidium sp. MPI-PUGE-AT-0058]|nr:BcPG4, endopolygalacturonase 4 [Rhexocercosporidium sp. MPI-PUGE-AT-0058]
MHVTTNTFLALLAVPLATVLASPIANAMPAPTAAPKQKEVEVALQKRAVSCTFSGSQYATAIKSKAACDTIVLQDLSVPPGVTLDMTGLKDNAVVFFSGKTVFASTPWVGPLFSVSGTGIRVTGLSGSTIDGNGAKYWDGGGGDSGMTKPKFFQAHNIVNGVIDQLTIVNPPVQVFSINGCTNTQFSSITIDAKAGDALGKNTDAFDIGNSDGITIKGATVYNQDDCVAVNSGTNIIFTGGFCSGGHGLSIGSVGGRDNNVVDGVQFLSSTVTKSVQAIRIKAKSGTTGTIKGVTYNGITMSSISKYGILIEQNYNGGDLHGTATTGVPITALTIKNISGTGAVASSGNDVIVTCGSSTSCTGWTWSSVAVTGGKKYGNCTNVPSVTVCS